MSQSLPLVVVKLGGRALEAPGAIDDLIDDLRGRDDRRWLIVHGGGAEVTAWSAKLGLAARFEDGLRVTDEPTMEVAAAVLAGLANKRLVAALRAGGQDAIGLSALDGGIVEAAPHPGAARLGAVAEVRAIHPELVHLLLRERKLPVLASIAAIEGRLFNLNADDLAGALAGALEADTLVLLSDAPGVILDGAVTPALEGHRIEATLERPEVEGGMRPKLRAAATALAGGAARVHIAAWGGTGTLSALLNGAANGTTLEAGDLPVQSLWPSR